LKVDWKYSILPYKAVSEDRMRHPEFQSRSGEASGIFQDYRESGGAQLFELQ